MKGDSTMDCRNCIFPRNCENYSANKCKDCEKGEPFLTDYACFKCKHEKTCVVPKREGRKTMSEKKEYIEKDVVRQKINELLVETCNKPVPPLRVKRVIEGIPAADVVEVCCEVGSFDRKNTGGSEEDVEMTNFEKIKQMSVEQMVAWLPVNCKMCPAYAMCSIECVGCVGTIRKWLESEADTEQREGERE